MATARFAFLAMAALALALGNVASAFTYSTTPVCPPTNSVTLMTPTQGVEAATFALLISFVVIAIGYMVSKVFPTTGIRGWLGTEYWELAKSVLLIISIYAILTIVSNLGVLITGNLPSEAIQGQVACLQNPQTGPAAYIGNLGALYSEDEYYLSTATYNTASAWDFVGQESAAIGLLQYLTIALYLPIPIPFPPPGFAFESGFSMKPYQNFMLETGNVIIQHFESSIYDLTQFVLYPVTILLVGLQGALPLLMSVGLGFLIPLGLIFRAFPFIRGVGGTLIAMGFGAAIVFPSILVFFNAPLTNGLSNLIYGPNGVPQVQIGQFQCTGASWIFCEMINVSLSALGQSNVFFMAWDAFGGIYPFWNGMLLYGFYLVMQLILFVFDLLILYTVTDNVAKLLGGTIRLSLGTKMKLA